MADDTDTTRPGEAEAIATVMPYLCVSGSAEHCGAHRAVCEPAAEAIVAAVYPVIAAAVREQAAQDIEAMDEPDWHTGGTLGAEEMGWAWAQDAAARIVRGGR